LVGRFGMRIGALVWLLCAAVYLEIVVRARRKPGPVDDNVWELTFVCGAITVTVLWAALMAWLAIRGVHEFSLAQR
jgi:hypothetical protein